MTLAKVLDPAITGPASRYVFEQQHAQLSSAVEQLAGLRFSIVLSAKWESSGLFNGEARAELRDEIRLLRHRYSNKIDEIAMDYGIQAAMEAQEGVERAVIVPSGMAPPPQPPAELAGYHDI